MTWVHLEDSRPKARKDYRCHLCERPIPKGEVHIKRAGIGEDGPISVRMHVACEAKTHDWDECDWECHDPAEFRCWLLGEGERAKHDAAMDAADDRFNQDDDTDPDQDAREATWARNEGTY